MIIPRKLKIEQQISKQIEKTYLWLLYMMASLIFYLLRGFEQNEIYFVIEPYLKNYWELDSLQQRFLSESSVSMRYQNLFHG
jgi:hypothetical protein